MAKTMVFIDSRVNDLDLLVSQLEAGTEYHVLDETYDGILQIEELLTGKSDYSSIQIISHGSAGAITIGSTLLNSNNLFLYQSQLDNIGHALTASGDLLLFGCNVGAGENGQQFIETLSQLTGADVAASDDLTGGTAVGGDWDLENMVGIVEATSLVTSNVNLTQTLGTTETLNFNVNDASLWNDGTGFVVSHTFEQLVFDLSPFHVSGSPSASIAGSSIGLDYALDATNVRFGVPITMGLSAGVFDLNYPVNAQIGLPSSVQPGDDFVVQTSQGVSTNPSMVVDGPSIECSVDAILQADITGHLGLTYDLPMLDPMATAIWGTLNSDNTFSNSTTSINKSVNLYTLALDSPSLVVNQNWNVSGSTQGGRFVFRNPYLTVGSEIDLNGLDGTATVVVPKNDTLADFSTTLHQDNPMFFVELDIDDIAGSAVSWLNPAVGALISRLDDQYRARFEMLGINLDTEYDTSFLSLNIMAGISPALKVSFDVQDIGVTLTANSGETHSGHLGDAFAFSSPQSGTMSISSTYSLEGTLTVTPGIYFNPKLSDLL